MITSKKPHNPNRTLAQALDAIGLSSEPSREIDGHLDLFDFGVPLCMCTAAQAWEIVNQVESGATIDKAVKLLRP